MNDRQELKKSFIKKCFIGKSGIRSGWIILMFILIYACLTFTAQYLFNLSSTLKQWAASQPQGVITPLGNIAYTGLELIILILSVKIIGLIERKSFADYSLPLITKESARLSIKGLFTGFAMVSVLIGLIALFGGYSCSGFAVSGVALIKCGILFAIGFYIVGIFEEFAFRGFLQSVLQRGIGFWPAAVVLSLLFGAMHLSNSNESWIGALLAMSFGLLAAFSLKLTGNLWFTIGVHAAFDWANGFFYSAPIAGQPVQGHLLNVSFNGPKWLTGGSIGPQGSVFAFVVLVFTALALQFLFAKRRK